MHVDFVLKQNSAPPRASMRVCRCCCEIKLCSASCLGACRFCFETKLCSASCLDACRFCFETRLRSASCLDACRFCFETKLCSALCLDACRVCFAMGQSSAPPCASMRVDASLEKNCLLPFLLPLLPPPPPPPPSPLTNGSNFDNLTTTTTNGRTRTAPCTLSAPTKQKWGLGCWPWLEGVGWPGGWAVAWAREATGWAGGRGWKPGRERRKPGKDNPRANVCSLPEAAVQWGQDRGERVLTPPSQPLNYRLDLLAGQPRRQVRGAEILPGKSRP